MEQRKIPLFLSRASKRGLYFFASTFFCELFHYRNIAHYCCYYYKCSYQHCHCFHNQSPYHLINTYFTSGFVSPFILVNNSFSSRIRGNSSFRSFYNLPTVVHLSPFIGVEKSTFNEFRTECCSTNTYIAGFCPFLHNLYLPLPIPFS